MRIVAIAGSLRRNSYNRALLENAKDLVGQRVELRVEGIEGIPVYSGDEEQRSGIPARVTELKQAIADADGLLLASPEYNNSLPGPLKNAIDWLSRPPKDIARVFGGKPVGLIGASPGRGGTRLAQQAWLQVFRALSMVPWFDGSVYMAGAGKAFDDDMKLVDADMRALLDKYLQGFVNFVEAGQP